MKSYYKTVFLSLPKWMTWTELNWSGEAILQFLAIVGQYDDYM